MHLLTSTVGCGTLARDTYTQGQRHHYRGTPAAVGRCVWVGGLFCRRASIGSEKVSLVRGVTALALEEPRGRHFVGSFALLTH